MGTFNDTYNEANCYYGNMIDHIGHELEMIGYPPKLRASKKPYRPEYVEIRCKTCFAKNGRLLSTIMGNSKACNDYQIFSQEEHGELT